MKINSVSKVILFVLLLTLVSFVSGCQSIVSGLAQSAAEEEYHDAAKAGRIGPAELALKQEEIRQQAQKVSNSTGKKEK